MANNCHSGKDSRFCDEILGKVCKDLATAVRQLPKGLCMDVLILSLAVKALNIIGDDMKYFEGKNSEKVDYLSNFHSTALVTDDWKLDGVGVEDDRVLLEQFYRCAAVFKGLSVGSQEIITDIIKKMGQVRQAMIYVYVQVKIVTRYSYFDQPTFIPSGNGFVFG
jgi:hypothetical protein